jgi:hypothetical protein
MVIAVYSTVGATAGGSYLHETSELWQLGTAAPKTKRRFFGQPKPTGYHGFRHLKTCGFAVKAKSDHKLGYKVTGVRAKSVIQYPESSIAG